MRRRRARRYRYRSCYITPTRRAQLRVLTAKLSAALGDPSTGMHRLSRVGVTLRWHQRWTLRLLFWPRCRRTRRWAQRYILHLLKEQL